MDVFVGIDKGEKHMKVSSTKSEMKCRELHTKEYGRQCRLLA